jgi:hypothetical protein
LDSIPSTAAHCEGVLSDERRRSQSYVRVETNADSARGSTTLWATDKAIKLEWRVAAVIFSNGNQRFDVHDLDKWLDSLKHGADDAHAIIARLGQHDRRAG